MLKLGFVFVTLNLFEFYLACSVYEYGVSQAEQNQIVNEHNNLRLQIARGTLPGQPKGINLKRFSWDKNLATAAQNIANTCVYGHVKVNDPRFGVGQNIYTSYASNYMKGANWTDPLLNPKYGWWNEYKIYKYPNGFSQATGHYTQMAWDDTKYVGCGYTYFPINNGPFKYQKFYVCNYGPAGNSGRAPYKTEYGVSQAEQNYIVNEHNNLRLKIARGKLPGQPRGVNLKRFSWDRNLAIAAQNIANTCIYGHVRVNDTRFGVGQNIYTFFASYYIKGANWTAPIYGWWDEYKIYKFPNGFSEATGHYTQMAWDDTKYVGCGYTYFPINKGAFKYQKYYVCNYGPAGNSGRAPYKTGKSGCENLC